MNPYIFRTLHRGEINTIDFLNYPGNEVVFVIYFRNKKRLKVSFSQISDICLTFFLSVDSEDNK